MTEVHLPQSCGSCGSHSLAETGTRTKMIHDFKDKRRSRLPATSSECTCEYGHVTVPETGIPDMQFGQHAMSIIAGP